jgi:hypothetical protein
VTVSVGGTGGAGGDAELVKVKSDGVISTEGDRSYGVQAQSIGGGGGSGGFSGSLAVGAGQTGAAVSVGVGGFGGTGGDGGDVEVDVIDLILTLGDDATAVLAQSIGGGGGSGGFSLTGAVGAGQTAGSGSLSGRRLWRRGGRRRRPGHGHQPRGHLDDRRAGQRHPGPIDRRRRRRGRLDGLAGGRRGSDQRRGRGRHRRLWGRRRRRQGEVTVDSFGQIQTHGDDAVGILAQSVGGGGGSGGFSLAVGVSVGQSTGAGSLTIGGGGGVGGDGGDVTVHSRDLIETRRSRLCDPGPVDRRRRRQRRLLGGGDGGPVVGQAQGRQRLGRRLRRGGRRRQGRDRRSATSAR